MALGLPEVHESYANESGGVKRIDPWGDHSAEAIRGFINDSRRVWDASGPDSYKARVAYVDQSVSSFVIDVVDGSVVSVRPFGVDYEVHPEVDLAGFPLTVDDVFDQALAHADESRIIPFDFNLGYIRSFHWTSLGVSGLSVHMDLVRDPQPELTARLEERSLAWSMSGMASYWMTVALDCFSCSEGRMTAVTFRISDGETSAATQGNRQVDLDQLVRYPHTVEEVFDIVSVGGNARALSVTWEPLGYPSEIVIDPIESLGGDEIRYQIAVSGSPPDPNTVPFAEMECGDVIAPLSSRLPLAGATTPDVDEALQRLAENGPAARRFVELFDLGVWSRSETELIVLGERMGRYATAVFEARDGEWVPENWGECGWRPVLTYWGPASWELSATPDPEDTAIEVTAREHACASGMTPDRSGRDVATLILEDEETITVFLIVERTWPGATCPANPPFPYTVDLGTEIGQRLLLDGSSES